ncbi:hypothetical protein M413DRAFT_424798 [Hebeloma cylindrosporum]|uniref:F-box domain-containing protein n=1 Tax=Hebeloma cylindrosporum TaxID=76867 RepID=A0A0C3BWG7_HEBCY|nr:hypothetical protein M413DRAFT_424798 [Hebeloma cylindrosporum h7]
MPFTIWQTGFTILELGSSQLAFLKIDVGDCMPVAASLRRLTSLHLDKRRSDMLLTFPMLVDILTAPYCLLYLSFKGNISPNTLPLQTAALDPDFQLHHLKALKISTRGLVAAKLLLFLSAPKLESLWLETNDGFRFFSIFCESSQVSSGCPKFPQLQYLILGGYNLPSIFSTFPSITHLRLIHIGTLALGNLETTLAGQWASLHTLVFSLFGLEESSKQTGDIVASWLRSRVSHGRPIHNFLVNHHVFGIIGTKFWTDIPVETKVQRVSAENYMEPWWNQEDWPDWIR